MSKRLMSAKVVHVDRLEWTFGANEGLTSGVGDSLMSEEITPPGESSAADFA